MAWNYQGIGSTLTVQNLKVKGKYDPDFVFLSETKNRRVKLEKLRCKLKFDGGWCVDPLGAKWWSGTLVEGGVAGDFNDIADEFEKEGGRNKERYKMKCFREMIEVSQLYDISFKGQRFTWFGLRDQAWVKERLDRALVNLDWMEACPNTQGFNLPAIGSDHSPMVVFSDFRDKKVKKKFKQRNKILIIKNGDCWFDDEERIMNCFTSFYEDLFKSEGVMWNDELLGVIPSGVTCEMNRALVAEISEKAVTEAVFQTGSYKAPGPDGFGGIFYHKFWDIIKGDVVEMVWGFFREGLMPSGLNETESAFVAGRMIHDTIIVAQEVFHYLKLKKTGRKNVMAVKLDINKAYDRVEWDFLEVVLKRLGFDAKWIGWIMECVRSVSYTLQINGKPSRMFCPSRGLRQGDRLPPFLFLIVADVLSRMILQSAQLSHIKGVKLSRNCPIVSHLFFTDDSLFFLEANVQNCRNLIDIIQIYCQASGQRVNYEKSSLVLSSNTTEDLKNVVQAEMNIVVATNPGVYFGIPALWGKTRSKALEYVKDEVVLRLKVWKNQYLSAGGKEGLIKAVACSIPTYVMF
ncbi:uncharacterized protein LOC105789674 [Gossypium raimondii]|uniref:uncharacterized protein LOC105789674 n=1 Tax=Gossypium raimondii TaxID=29730 RepID=UPI00063B0885|nr:uncharacterized protein LOC105789674 [Gossypium raimondii]